MKYKAIIWDLDGTLLNTLEDLADSVNASLEKFNLPTRDLEEIRNFVGNGIGKLIERAIGENGPTDMASDVLAYFRVYYGANCKNKTRPYDGIIELLRDLKEKGYKLAIVSNKIDSAVKELSKEYFGDIFDASIGEMVNVKRKPSPDTVLFALNEIGESIEDAIYIGDSEVDVLTAKNANLDCISVSWGFRTVEELEKNGATRIIGTVDELREILL